MSLFLMKVLYWFSLVYVIVNLTSYLIMFWLYVAIGPFMTEDKAGALFIAGGIITIAFCGLAGVLGAEIKWKETHNGVSKEGNPYLDL